jgi:hypothetical protein
MFASKTLAERNDDPEPWMGRGLGGTRHGGFGGWADDHSPRPEFQHGTIPANPILVAFRAGDYKPGDLSVNIFDVELQKVTREQDRHAARVLTLLASLA